MPGVFVSVAGYQRREPGQVSQAGRSSRCLSVSIRGHRRNFVKITKKQRHSGHGWTPMNTDKKPPVI